MAGNANAIVMNDTGTGDTRTAEMKDALRVIHKLEPQALKSYARSVLMADKTDDHDATIGQDEIKKIENHLVDLTQAVQDAGEPLFDLPLSLITTQICPFLPSRTDWNNSYWSKSPSRSLPAPVLRVLFCRLGLLACVVHLPAPTWNCIISTL